MSMSIERDGIDNIYVNVDFNNTDPNDIVPTPAVFNATKTIPILDKANDYFCSVIRFDIPLDQIPIFIMPVNMNQAIPRDPTQTPFIIGIQYGVNTNPSTYFSQNVFYFPQNSYTAPSQNDPNKVQIITPYYYVNNYQVLIDMINISLKLAINASGVGVLLDGLGIKQPFFHIILLHN